MTEDEAKEKWCPHSDAPQGHPHGCCIGSACMAWRHVSSADLREAKQAAQDGRKIDAIKALRRTRPELDLLAAKHVVEGETPWPSESDGFCGLAGAMR